MKVREKVRMTRTHPVSHMIKTTEELVNSVLVTCPHCNYTFSLPLKFTGTKLGFTYSKRCPRCRRLLKIPV
jgi:uncharacterized paraquat-inducible protein A